MKTPEHTNDTITASVTWQWTLLSSDE